MTKIKDYPCMDIFFDTKNQLLTTVWTGENSEISDHEIKEIITECANLTRQHKPKYYISDNSQQKFIYNVNIQKWVATTLAQSCIEIGLKKYAIVMPTELITGLSIEQTVEEAGELPFELKNFKNMNAVMEWFSE